jgi:hypothetical protein
MAAVLLASMMLGLLGGCAVKPAWEPGVAASWEGRRLADLIYAWGPPNKVHALDDGRQVVSYEHNGVYSWVDYSTGREVSPYGAAWCVASFFARADGIIERGSLEGNVVGCNALLPRKPAGR